jgi:hypothetical protein
LIILLGTIVPWFAGAAVIVRWIWTHAS